MKARRQTRGWSRQRGTSAILCLTNPSVYWVEESFSENPSCDEINVGDEYVHLFSELSILVFDDLSKFRLAPFAKSRQRCKNSTCSYRRTIVNNLS